MSRTATRYGEEILTKFAQKETISDNIILSPNNTGIVEFNSQLKIQGGNPGVDKVLTSNSVGLATWETPIAGRDSIETKLTSIDDNKSLTDDNKQSIYPIEIDDDYTITLPSYSTGLSYKFLLTDTSDISSNPTIKISLHNDDITNNKYIYGNYNSSYYSNKQSEDAIGQVDVLCGAIMFMDKQVFEDT